MKMRTYLIIINCLVGLLGGTLYAAPKVASPLSKKVSTIPAGPKIRILLEKNAHSALLEAKGEYAVINKSTGNLLSSGQVGKRFVVHALQHGLRWGEEYPDVYQISIIPQGSSTSFYINGIQYKGAISIYHAKDNKIMIVNEAPLEDYLKAKLALEIQEDLSKEALAALVIAARTEAFALVKANATSKRPWDLTAQEAKYFGYAVTHQKNAVDEAVDWTRFMVLESIKDGNPFARLLLSPEKAQELAEQGYDAKKILQSTYPSSKLSVTAAPKSAAVR